MDLKIIMTQNWLTRKALQDGRPITIFLMLLLLVGSLLYWKGVSWISATQSQVFSDREYWRAWTTMFAHADISHVLANLFLFIPFSYYLTGYFSRLFFPVAAFFVGGLVNLAVLATMPSHVTLVGASGVVYWMGGAWMTLFLLIEKRDSLAKRLIKVVGISAIVFFPESYKPEVSYLCHFLGFLTGIASALLYYKLNESTIKDAERLQLIYDGPLTDEPYWLAEEPQDM
jgi:rhomboid protease GluP